MHRLHFFAALAFATACREPNVIPGIDSTRPQLIDVQPKSITLKQGESQQFTATVRDVVGRVIPNAAVSWRSTDPSLLSVNESGFATAVSATSSFSFATVVASVGSIADSVGVTISPKGVFNVWPDTNALVVGITRKLASRTITPGQAATLDIVAVNASSWTSSDATVATVDAQGMVTAVREGQTQITASLSDGRVSSAQVFVLPATTLRFSAIYPAGGFTLAGPLTTAGCGVNVADGGMYCWGDFGILWGEANGPPPPYLRSTLPGSYVQAFDRCERLTRFGAIQIVWLDRTRCSEVPVRVFPQSTFSTTATWNCGLSTANEALCWGSNSAGQLGIGATDTLKHGATPAATSERFSFLTGSQTRCGLRGDGAAFCWGDAYGATPAPMTGNVTWRRLARNGSCGIAADSTAYCWSGNNPPQQVGSGMKFTDIIGANIPQRCALAASGNLYCWQLSSFNGPYIEPPVLVTASASFTSLTFDFVGPSGFGTGVCALTAGGDVYCVSQSGSGSSTTFSAQLQNLGGLKFKRVLGNCGIALDDKTYCWSVGGTPVVQQLPRQ